VQLQKYLVRRLLQLIPVILVVIVLNFVLMQLAPGDITYILAGEEPDPEYVEYLRHKYGLDRPIHEQLFVYMGRVLQGDLGDSYRYREPVLSVIGRHLAPTLLLMITSLFMASVIGTAIGTFLAPRAGSPTDVTVSILAVSSYSIPVFWLGLMLILLFAIRLDWFPVSGMYDVLRSNKGIDRVLDVLYHLVLPALTLSLVWLGQYVRLARSSVLQVLNEDFITAVRAVGFRPNTILVHHALRNALLPIVSVLGIQLGLAIGGAVLTETVFAWPGLGRVIYEGILARDTPLIMGAYVVMSVCVALASLLADLLYASLDPRVVY
jgi:peptide/nickel transport system permease protein